MESSTGTIIPESYISTFAPIAKRRVVLAGYRLAYMIESVYGDGYKYNNLDIIEDLDPDQTFAEPDS